MLWNLKLGVRWWFDESSLLAAQVSHCLPVLLPLPITLWNLAFGKCDLTWHIGLCECKYLPRGSFIALILPKGPIWSQELWDYNIEITWNSRNLEKTNFLIHSLASRVLLGYRNKTLLFRLQVGWFFRAQLVLPSSSERLLWTVVHAQAPPPDPWSWGGIRLGIRVAIVCSDHGFQVGAGLQEVSKAAHIPLLNGSFSISCSLQLNFEWLWRRYRI